LSFLAGAREATEDRRDGKRRHQVVLATVDFVRRNRLADTGRVYPRTPRARGVDLTVLLELLEERKRHDIVGVDEADGFAAAPEIIWRTSA
jgi:hypothetical protein